MKPYGVDPKHDDDCCPGHSRYSSDTYRNRRSKKAQTRDTKTAHRAERRRCALLLRKSWPRLKGLGAVLAFYARRDPQPAVERSAPLEWTCRVLPSGEVVHGVIRPEVSVEEESGRCG